ncbi:lysophospholipid acyltransferase [Tulasnella sp. 419]|nr:lysophospholipid acyltransferase [Tulasnella sp. 419]
MDAAFDKLAGLVGTGAGELKLLACFFVSYPLGSVFVRLPKDKPYLKHAFSVVVAAFFLLKVLKLYSGTTVVLLDSLFTYYVAKYMKSDKMPVVVFVAIMGHLLVSHVYRMQYPSDVVEISGAQMVLTMKLTTFAWNVHDGRQPAESLDKALLETRVTEFPSLLTFLGYSFYFPAFLIGPACTYSDYIAMVDETVYEEFKPPTPLSSDNEDDNAKTRKSRKRVPKGRKRVAYQKMIWGLVNFGLFAVFGSTYNYLHILEDWWPRTPFWYRFLFTQACGFFARTKYYGAWLLTEGACIFTGLGFNGWTPDGRTKWDKAANLDIPNIELAPSFKVLLDSWNIHTNTWLRNCVYKRVVPKGQKPGFVASQVTFLTSALWHGFYGGYYLTFFVGGFFSAAAKQSRAYLRPLVLPPLLPPKPDTKLPLPEPTFVKTLYDWAGTAVTIMILNYIVAPFLILNFWDSIEAWRRLNWYGHWMIFSWLAIGTLGGKTWLKKISKQRIAQASAKQAAEVKEIRTESKKERKDTEVTYIPPVDEAVKEVEAKVYQAVKQAEKKLQST